jgi:N-glycosidase YbiA
VTIFPPIPNDNRILFYRRDRRDFGFLSHFYPSPIVLDGEQWPTTEHYYQAQKSLDPAYRRAIRACETPGEAKKCAITQTKNPDSTTNLRSWFALKDREPRVDWFEVKRDIMCRADLAKYEQNPHLAELLLACGNAEIVEDSSSDSFWGIGRDGDGENWAGRIIEEVRAHLRAQRDRMRRQRVRSTRTKKLTSVGFAAQEV